jgi:hypothetical protein
MGLCNPKPRAAAYGFTKTMMLNARQPQSLESLVGQVKWVSGSHPGTSLTARATPLSIRERGRFCVAGPGVRATPAARLGLPLHSASNVVFALLELDRH